jgi:hypothetical protein
MKAYEGTFRYFQGLKVPKEDGRGGGEDAKKKTQSVNISMKGITVNKPLVAAFCHFPDC